MKLNFTKSKKLKLFQVQDSLWRITWKVLTVLLHTSSHTLTQPAMTSASIPAAYSWIPNPVRRTMFTPEGVPKWYYSYFTNYMYYSQYRYTGSYGSRGWLKHRNSGLLIISGKILIASLSLGTVTSSGKCYD
jgi:hypothetical protein